MFGASEGAITEVKTEEIVTKSGNFFEEFADRARTAVYKWCISNKFIVPNLISLTINDDTAPEILLTDDNGKTIGVEVIPINDPKTNLDVDLIISDVLTLFGGLERDYDNFYIVFVADTRKVNLLVLDILRASDLRYIKNVIYIYGFLDKNGDFVVHI